MTRLPDHECEKRCAAAINAEMITARDLGRELGKVLARFDSGEQRRALITKNGKIVAVLFPVGSP